MGQFSPSISFCFTVRAWSLCRIVSAITTLDCKYACRISSALEFPRTHVNRRKSTSVCFCLFVPSFHKGAMLFVLGNSGALISLSHAATQRIVKPSRKSLVISYRDIETNLLPFKWRVMFITGNTRTMAQCRLKMLKNEALWGKQIRGIEIEQDRMELKAGVTPDK